MVFGARLKKAGVCVCLLPGKEDSLPVLEKAADAVGQKDRLLGSWATSINTPN